MDALGRHPKTGDATLESLLADLRRGEPEAVEQLVHHYGPLLLRVVRARLAGRLRRRFDSTDFTQAVWKSFFCQAHEVRFQSEAELVAYLSEMARNKVRLEQRDARRLRRDQQKEVASKSAAALLQQLRSREPTPSAVLTAVDEKERLLGDTTELFRQALDLRVSGYSNDEIAARLEVSVRAIERFFAVLRTESMKCRNS